MYNCLHISIVFVKKFFLYSCYVYCVYLWSWFHPSLMNTFAAEFPYCFAAAPVKKFNFFYIFGFCFVCHYEGVPLFFFILNIQTIGNSSSDSMSWPVYCSINSAFSCAIMQHIQMVSKHSVAFLGHWSYPLPPAQDLCWFCWNNKNNY